MGKLRNRVITEKRIYDDPQHPETSDYDVSLPRTVPKAVHDPETGETMDVTMKRVSKTASDALAAANAAQGTANEALEIAELAKSTAEAAAEAIAAVQNTISATPSQFGSPVYTGAKQKPTWNNYPVEMLTITYGEARVSEEAFAGETDAGDYKAYATPKEGYTWGDKSKTERELTWSIKRATIAAMPSVKNPLVYTGAAQVPEWLNFNAAQLTKTETAKTDAGDYGSSFAPTANYQWPDGTTAAKTVPWSIARATLTVPTQSGTLTYNGQAQSPTLSGYDAAKMTLGGDTSGTNAKGYSVTVTPKANYQWPDGSSSAKSVSWSIVKAAGSLSLSPTSATLGGVGEVQVIAVTRAGDGAISATSSNTGVATAQVSGNNVVVTGKGVGSATITVKVAEGTNHMAPSNKTASISVVKPTVANSTWDNIKTISEAGNAASYFAVGDVKSIRLNGTVQGFTFSNLAIDAFILGFNHNSGREGNNRIHWLIGKIGGKDVALCDSQYNSSGSSAGFRMNQSNTNSGGWNGSYMRKTVLGNSGTPSSPPANSLLAALPSDLRAVMKGTTKYTDNTGGGSDTASYVTSTTDYLFLLAEFEVWGTRYGANSAEQNYQKQYDYFKAGNSRVAYDHRNTGSAVWWWLRSPYYNYSSSFRDVFTDGGTNCNICVLLGGGPRRLFYLILRRVSRPYPAPARGRVSGRRAGSR